MDGRRVLRESRGHFKQVPGLGEADGVGDVGNGVKVLVPMFVEQGEKIRVNTETTEYMERVK